MAAKASITVIEGVDQGLTIDLPEGTTVIGRGKADVVLKDKKVSARHCAFSLEGSHVWVEDLQSTNGTFIGGRRINKKEMLQNLDEIVVGLSKLSVAIVEELKRPEIRLDPPPMPEGEDGAQESSNEEVSLPPADATYRETGIQRIDNLIQDELASFSKWDHPSDKSTGGTGPHSVPKIKVHLNVRRGPEGVTNFTCTEPVTTMGRRDVDVRLNDLDCSRKHAQIEIIAGDKAYLRDLASTNGTFVNGKKIVHQELKTGDLIQVGQTIFEVKIES